MTKMEDDKMKKDQKRFLTQLNLTPPHSQSKGEILDGGCMIIWTDVVSFFHLLLYIHFKILCVWLSIVDTFGWMDEY